MAMARAMRAWLLGQLGRALLRLLGAGVPLTAPTDEEIEEMLLRYYQPERGER